jgi:hypothetical protein
MEDIRMSFSLNGAATGRTRPDAMPGRLLPALALALLFLNWPSPAGGAVLVESDGIEVQGASSLAGEAESLLRIFPEIRADLHRATGWELRSRPRVVLTSDARLFERMTGSRFISAFAVPSDGVVAMLVGGARSNPALMRGILTHELCHLLLHENIEDGRLPRWLDEGVCQWVSGSLGEILSGASVNRIDLDVAGRAIPLAELAVDLPGDDREMVLAYAVSRGFVEYLVDRFGVDGLQRLLGRLKEGDGLEEAMTLSLGSSLADLEAGWLQTLRSGGAWLSWASRHFYDLLFFTMAFLTILAAVRLMVRRKSRLAEMEEMEEEE